MKTEEHKNKLLDIIEECNACSMTLKDVIEKQPTPNGQIHVVRMVDVHRIISNKF